MKGDNRLVVAKLARTAKGGLIAVDSAADTFGCTTRQAALKLAALARRGWLQRARRGLYLVLPLEVEPGKQTVAEDPWILGQEVFSPCYIGGWSAAEHWGLTEQIFRSILVVTAARVRAKTIVLLGQEFRLFRVKADRMEGIGTIWRGSQRVRISSKERTIVDCLRNPELCGGIRTAASMLSQYLNSSESNPEKLLAELRSAGSGAVWKRFGYLMEALWPGRNTFISEALAKRTAGNVKLDPAVSAKGKLLRRWRLWGNVRFTNQSDSA
jgi:predicted transcriptional regulator of viral defense system